MEGKHICLICNGTGKTSNGECPLCKLKWSSTRITRREELQDLIGVAKVVKNDPMKFAEFDRGWDLESNQQVSNLSEAKDMLEVLKETRERLVSIAARNAEQRAEYHGIAGVLEKYPQTKEIGKFITDAYHKLRRSWLIIEKTEEMLSATIAGLE